MLSSDPHIIAGLGNPGIEYALTRHNVGAMVIDSIIDDRDLDITEVREGSFAQMSVSGSPVYLFKPNTYVNSSGRAVKAFMARFQVKTGDLIVIHDDLDLDLAGLRIKAGGRSGGHRGVDSIIGALGADDFIRVKVGIGRPPGRKDPAEFVLEPFTEAEAPEISVTIAEAADAVVSIIENGVEAGMNRYNQR